MAKIVDESPLDRKVKAFLARGVSMSQVRGYSFERSAGQWPELTVKIIADGLEEIEITEDER